MTVNDFAKYVIDNMRRASLANALNIANKLDNPEYYAFPEFVECMNDYVAQLVANGKMDAIRSSKILVASSEALSAYKSTNKYNKLMIIDNFIINVWKSFC